MFFNYRLLFLSLTVICSSIIYSMSIERLPQEYQEYLSAIFKGNNQKAECILRENPTIDSNIIDPKEGIPHTVYWCYSSDNGYMLRILIDRDLDTSHLGTYLYWTMVKIQGNFKPKFFKVLVEQGALRQLTPEQQLDVFNSLLLLPALYKHEAVTCALNNGLDKVTIKRYLVNLFKFIADKSKQWELDAYTIYAIHCSNMYEVYSVPQTHATKEHVNQKCRETLADYRKIFDTLKKNGLDLTLKTSDYKELLSFLANNGSTDLAKYLILNNGLLAASDFESIITNARAHSETKENDPIALTFIDELKEKYLILIQNDAAGITDQQEAAIQDILDYLKQQWVTHKNKSVIKLLRQCALVQYYLKNFTTPEIAHKIAQYAITDFQDQKLDYLPSYEKIEALTNQKMLEYAALGTQNTNSSTQNTQT